MRLQNISHQTPKKDFIAELHAQIKRIQDESDEHEYIQNIEGTKDTQTLACLGSYRVICSWFDFCITSKRNIRAWLPTTQNLMLFHQKQKSILFLSRANHGSHSLSGFDRSSGSVVAMHTPVAAWARNLKHVFLFYCLKLLWRQL